MSRHLCAVQLPPEPPPLLPSDTQLASLRYTGWTSFFRDATNEVLLMHTRTGAVRNAPWIALRTPSGLPYFANLVSRETRWLPPHNWMPGWVSRSPFDALNTAEHPYPQWQNGRVFDPRLPLVGSSSRQCVEGGAPYLHEYGKPAYQPDQHDTPLTYPLDGFVWVTTPPFPDLGVALSTSFQWVLAESAPPASELAVVPERLGYLAGRCEPGTPVRRPSCYDASHTAAETASLASISPSDASVPAAISPLPVRRWCRHGRRLSSRAARFLETPIQLWDIEN